MAKKLDLRTKAAPAVQEAVVAPVNQFPFPSGKKIQLTPEEKDFLKAAGWQEGDPVPDLKSFMAAAAAEQAQVVSDLETSGAKTIAPEMLNFEDLPPEKQAELTQAFEDLRQAPITNAEQPASPEMAAPGVAEAIEVASQEDGLDVVDDPAQAIEDYVEDDDRIGVVQKPDVICAHCGWDTTRKATPETTDRDKQDFLMSILGGVRFYKDVQLFGASVTVRYRTLLTEEADTALQQTAYDFRDGKVPDQGEFYRVFNNYRLAMSIDKISTPSAVHPVPALDEIEWDEPGPDEPLQTALPALEKWMHVNVLSSESMRRVVGLEHQRFQRLVEQLEARVDDSDFWKETALGP